MKARLEFRTLGAFSVAWSGREIPAEAWGRRRAAALLKAVIGEPGARCSADLLVERLWPGSAPNAGRTNLRVKLHEVRAILAEHAPPEFDLAGRPPVRFDGGVVSIDPLCGPWIDALEFEREAVAALDADLPARGVAQSCAQALRAWGGEYLPDDNDEATLALRERFGRLHRALLLRAAGAWHRLGEGDREIQLLEQAFDAAPYDEQVAGLLIGREASRARRHRVRELYDRHAKALTERAGLAPSERLQRLAGFGAAAEANASQSMRLPMPIVDRAEPLASATELIERAVSGGTCFLAICGAQGVGKSRLLEEIERAACAHGMSVGRARCFRDPRVEHVALDALGVFAQIVRSLDAGPNADRALAALTDAGERAEEIPTIIPTFRRMLRELNGDRPLLLAIDDAHLAPAAALPRLHDAGDGIVSERMLLVAAFRPPLRPAVRGALGVNVLDLEPLDRTACIEVVTQAFDMPPAPELAQALVDLWPGDLGVIVAAAQHARLAGLATRAGRRWELTPGTQAAALIPEIARRMVTRRIGQLDPVADEVLKAIAYAGARADVSVMAIMLDRDEATVAAAVDELVQAGLAASDGRHVDAPLAVRLISAAAVSMRRQSLFIERLAEALMRASAGRS